MNFPRSKSAVTGISSLLNAAEYDFDMATSSKSVHQTAVAQPTGASDWFSRVAHVSPNNSSSPSPSSHNNAVARDNVLWSLPTPPLQPYFQPLQLPTMHVPFMSAGSSLFDRSLLRPHEQIQIVDQTACESREMSDQPPQEPPSKLHACPWEQCTRVFKRYYNMKSHLRSHTGERPFVCPLCDRAFGRNHDLRRHHITVHTEQKEFKCTNCDKQFSRKDALTRHCSTMECRRNFQITTPPASFL